MKIILRDSLTGLYYGGNQGWTVDVPGAIEFESSTAAAALALAEKLENVDVILRYQNPTCELRLPLAVCVPAAPGATVNNGVDASRVKDSPKRL